MPSSTQKLTGCDQKKASQPLDVTSMLGLDPFYENSIQITTVPHFNRFVMAVYLVHKESPELLLQKLRLKGLRVAFYTKGLIQQKLKEDADCEIATTCLRVSLVCPLGKMRIITPCRAVTCDHVQCFDASLYLQMNEKKPTWTCPVCDKAAHYDTLSVDEYFVEVLKSDRLPQDCKEIQLLADGSWTPLANTVSREQHSSAAPSVSIESQPGAEVELSSDEECEVVDWKVEKKKTPRRPRTPDEINLVSSSDSSDDDSSSDSQVVLPFKKRKTANIIEDVVSVPNSPSIIDLDSDPPDYESSERTCSPPETDEVSDSERYSTDHKAAASPKNSPLNMPDLSPAYDLNLPGSSSSTVDPLRWREFAGSSSYRTDTALSAIISSTVIVNASRATDEKADEHSKVQEIASPPFRPFPSDDDLGLSPSQTSDIPHLPDCDSKAEAPLLPSLALMGPSFLPENTSVPVTVRCEDGESDKAVSRSASESSRCHSPDLRRNPHCDSPNSSHSPSPPHLSPARRSPSDHESDSSPNKLPLACSSPSPSVSPLAFDYYAPSSCSIVNSERLTEAPLPPLPDPNPSINPFYRPTPPTILRKGLSIRLKRTAPSNEETDVASTSGSTITCPEVEAASSSESSDIEVNLRLSDDRKSSPERVSNVWRIITPIDDCTLKCPSEQVTPTSNSLLDHVYSFSAACFPAENRTINVDENSDNVRFRPAILRQSRPTVRRSPVATVTSPDSSSGTGTISFIEEQNRGFNEMPDLRCHSPQPPKPYR